MKHTAIFHQTERKALNPNLIQNIFLLYLCNLAFLERLETCSQTYSFCSFKSCSALFAHVTVHKRWVQDQIQKFLKVLAFKEQIKTALIPLSWQLQFEYPLHTYFLLHFQVGNLFSTVLVKYHMFLEYVWRLPTLTVCFKYAWGSFALKADLLMYCNGYYHGLLTKYINVNERHNKLSEIQIKPCFLIITVWMDTDK